MKLKRFSKIAFFVVPQLALFSIPGWSKTNDSFSSPSISKIGQRVEDFVPQGWRVEMDFRGDVTGTGSDGHVLVLADWEKAPTGKMNSNVTGRRILLVLIKERENLKRLAIGARVLRCPDCYGALSGPGGGVPTIRINKGQIQVNETGGSRNAWDVTLEFRFDSSIQKFQLARKILIESDRIDLSGDTTTIDYIAQTYVHERHPNRTNKKQPKVIIKKKFSVTKHFLEDYNFEFEWQL